TTAWGRITGRPGAFDQRPTRRRLPGLGHAALLPPCPARLGRGCEPQIMPEVSGMSEAREVAPCRSRRHRDGALTAPQSLEGLDDGREAPGFPRLVECLLQPLSARSRCGDGLDVCLNNHRRRRGGTDDVTEPAP